MRKLIIVCYIMLFASFLLIDYPATVYAEQKATHDLYERTWHCTDLLRSDSPIALDTASKIATNLFSSKDSRVDYFDRGEGEDVLRHFSEQLYLYANRQIDSGSISNAFAADRIQLIMLSKLSSLDPQQELGLVAKHTGNQIDPTVLSDQTFKVSEGIFLYGVVISFLEQSLRKIAAVGSNYDSQLSAVWPKLEDARSTLRKNLKLIAESTESTDAIDVKRSYQLSVTANTETKSPIEELNKVLAPILEVRPRRR